MSLSKADILAFGKGPKSSVEVEGKTVHLRVMTGAERHAFFATFGDKDNDVTSHLLVRCICDEHGNRLFLDGDVVELSANVPATTLDVLGKEAAKINRIGSDSVEDAKKN